MIEDKDVESEIESFLGDWYGEHQPMRHWFAIFYKELVMMSEVSLAFIARPGVSYSLRPRLNNGNGREFFAIIDVIDDDPANRWLSVCFYEDMITDPEGRGESIPGGLGGSDGYCFDLPDDDTDFGRYLIARLREARTAAAA
ncbi:MAG: hypothetical protein OEL83_02115 [Desulforhopalus sp.]|nr:hypothetical protein [Desulforhopalus sp.]